MNIASCVIQQIRSKLFTSFQLILLSPTHNLISRLWSLQSFLRTMLYLVLVLLTRNGTNNFSCLLHLDVLNNINRVCRGVPTISTERDSERTQNSSDSLCRATSPIKGGNDGWSRSSVTKVTGWVQSQALTKGTVSTDRRETQGHTARSRVRQSMETRKSWTLNLLQLNKTAVSKVIMIITVCVFTRVSTCCNDLFFQP